ncbi:hypothetical protein AJ79_08082 [Helicocarpus griseus UAMH5409]|uniref:RNase III domain-containing protein n=1 Tax=Helicocarpus griseus UAMH5409 TaxID=1447875 RepID=A0A2B7WWG3_9EURO|nr:hypothetical protein AJ79_08082 [Helicocarpus griseus UAMH5409]
MPAERKTLVEYPEVRIYAVENVIGYKFADSMLCLKAIQVKHFINQFGNQALVQLGDAALRLALCSAGYERYAYAEQILEVVDVKATNANLAKLGFPRKLNGYIIERESAELGERSVATLVEALLSAVYVDCKGDMTTVKKVMETLDLCWKTEDLSRRGETSEGKSNSK